VFKNYEQKILRIFMSKLYTVTLTYGTIPFPSMFRNLVSCTAEEVYDNTSKLMASLCLHTVRGYHILFKIFVYSTPP